MSIGINITAIKQSETGTLVTYKYTNDGNLFGEFEFNTDNGEGKPSQFIHGEENMQFYMQAYIAVKRSWEKGNLPKKIVRAC